MNILGIDVSKKTLHSCLLSAAQPDKARHKVVANTPEGIATLQRWACDKTQAGCSDLQVVLEATGPYHEVAATQLHTAGCSVAVVNPARVKPFAQGQGLRTKTDRLDAYAIALFGQKNTLRLWQPPAPEYQQLQALLQRLNAVEGDLQREANRHEKLTVQAHTSPEVHQSLARSIHFLEQEKQQLLQDINSHIDQFPILKHDQQLLQSIPGVGPTLATVMVALLYHGERFDKASQVAAYAGLIPLEHQSGSSVRKPPRLSKAGPAQLRAKLYMPALVACRYNPDVCHLYQRLLARGKCKMAALGAAMRKLLHICFGVIKHQTPYQPQITASGG